MKKIINCLNSVQMFIGLFYFLLGSVCLYGGIRLLLIDEALFLRVFGFLCILLGSLSCFDISFLHFKKGIYYVRHYTKQERDEAGDIILCRKDW